MLFHGENKNIFSNLRRDFSRSEMFAKYVYHRNNLVPLKIIQRENKAYGEHNVFITYKKGTFSSALKKNNLQI